MLVQLLAFVGVSAVVICTPGPDTALTVRNALLGGRRSGVATALGVTAGLCVWTLAASAGLAAVLRASEPAFLAVKIAGAVYLVFLGAQALLAAVRTRSAPDEGRPRAEASPWLGFRQGLFSNLGNPKIAVFFTSLLPQFAPGGHASFAVLALLGLLFCGLGAIWLSSYAVAVAKARALLSRARVRRAMDAVTGTVLVAFGLRLATEH
jgi:threonine/homoserine/homoserine lactone efflux protein